MSKSQRVETCMAIEGMTSVGGLAVMDLFIGQAVQHHDSGALVEFGTYKGRTAALFAQYATEQRPLHAVEQSDYLEIDRLRAISPHVTWHKTKSEPFCRDQLGGELGGRGVIATHHDASHFFDNVATELAAVVPAMHPRGVMILDDFNDSFSQVRAAYYHLRYARAFPFELLLVGFNKAILVHQDAFAHYEAMVLASALTELRGYGLNCSLCRSDIHEHARGFFVAPKKTPAEDDHYDTRFWGERFYQPADKYLGS